MKKFVTILVMAILIVICCPMTYASGSEIVYVEFGSYPQTAVAETQELENAVYDVNGDCEIEGVHYRRVQDWYGNYYYFRWEPIVWQVVDGLLLARDVIDCKMYDEQEVRYDPNWAVPLPYCYPVTWEESSLYSWLNEDFIDIAFDEDEKKLLVDEVSLFTAEGAKAIHDANTQHIYLQKTATDYADFIGIEPRATEFSNGDTEWLLRDISPIAPSAVWTISNAGTINTGIGVLLNEFGMGLVPCLKVYDLSALTQWSDIMPEAEVLLYRAGGRVEMFQQSEVESALAEGWYLTEEEAKVASGIDMETRFATSSLSKNYDWYVSRSPAISIKASQKNMTALEVIDYIKPLMDEFYTGNIDDYMEIHVEFPYNGSVASSLSDFSDKISNHIFDVVQTCWSSYGNITCAGAGGRLTGSDGSDYEITMRLSLNGDGNYSENSTTYHNTIHQLVAEAKAYSDRPVGQLQYLRVFFAENTMYDGSLWSNEPSTLITSGVGVCGTYANFVSDFCKLLDIPCLFLVNDGINHAWNAVYIDGEWYQLDFTSCWTGYKVDGISYEHNPNGFPVEHTAANVDFLDEYSVMLGHVFGTHEKDDLNEVEYAYVKALFADDAKSDIVNDTLVKNLYIVPQESSSPDDSLTKVRLRIKGTKDLKVLGVPSNENLLNPVWQSSDEKVATVNQDGVVTGVGKGTAKITVSLDTQMTAEVEVKIVNIILPKNK